MKSKLQSLKFDKVNQKQARNMMLFLAFFMFSLGSAFAQFGAGGSDNNNGDVRLVYVSGQQNSVEALKTLGTSNEIIVQSIKGAPQQLHSIRVKIQLPPGVLYTPSSFAITDNNNVTVQPLANVYVLAEDDISDLNAPIFSIFNNGIETELWDAGDYIQFTFERTAGCAAVTYKEDGNTFKDTAEISYVKTGFPGVQTATDTNALLANYDLLAASVSISNITAVNGTVGSFVHTREVTDFNGGNAGVQEVIHTVKLGSSVNVEPSVGAYSFSYLGNVISPSTTSTDGAGVTTNTYIINLSSNPNYSGGNPGFEDGNSFFDAGESLVFEESFTLKDCIDTGIQHQVEWTCQSSKITEGNVLFGANNPELDIDILENHRNISGVNHIRLKITNTASATAAAGFAKDILINVALGSNNQSGTTSYNNNPHWGTTRYNVRSFSNFSLGSETVQVPFTPEDWGSDNSSTSTTSTHALLPNTNINVDVDGVGGLQDIDGDNYYDDLAPGDSFVIEFDYEVLPRDNNCGTGRFDYMQWEHVFVDALTKDQCDSARPTEGVDLGYNNFIRDYNNATVFEQDTDIEELVPFEVALRPYLYSNFNHNDHAMINANGDSEFTVSIEVPRGVDLVAGSPPEFSQTNGAYIVGLPGAGTNVISYTSTDILSGFTLREFSDFFARFPLVMNCTELELGGVTSVINISYETSLKLYDAPGGNLVFERDIHCGNFEPIIEHSCNPPCAGPNITGLDAYRITAGWSDNTMTSKVDLTSTNPDGSPVYELDKYLAGDEMMVETSGFMSSLSSDNLHFIQNYTTDGLTAGANDIEFVSGTIVITKFGGSTTLELPVSAPIVTSSGNTHTLDYDLSSALSDPIVGGLIEDQDTFEVNFKYKFTTDTYTNFGYHILSGFRGRYYVDETLTGSTSNVANDNDNDGIPNERLSCFDWGDQVAYLRPDNLSYGVANSTFEYCAEVWANLINDYTRSNSPHLHTGEYRPTTMIQSTEITIPDGAKILDVRQYNNEGYFYVSTGELDISPALGTPGVNTYTVTPNRAAGYRDQNQTSSVSYRMQVLVKGSCELKDASEGLPIPIITSTSIVQHMAYTETPLPEQLLTRTPSARLYYTKPTFIFQPLSSAIIVGFGPEADFDLRVVNNSSSTGDVGFNWIKIPANSNITIVGAEDITSSSIPLNIVQVGDDSYVEIGNLDAGETKDIRVSATYTSCTDVPVDFSLGWDCDAYPTNYGDVSSVCYDNTVQLTLQPAAGQVQQTITEPQPVGPFAMCDTIIYDVEYSSAQVATTINPESSLTLFNGASAVSITNIEAEYPAGSNNWEDLVTTISGGDTYVSPIIHSAMTPLYGGIPGTGAVGPSVNDRKVIVRYTLQTTCDFVSNSPLTFTVSGDVPCGEPTVGNGSKSVSNGIEIIGLDATYDALSTISLPDFANPDGGHIDGCSSQETINIFTTISELPSSPGASTGDFDYGRVVLPTGVTYVDGSFLNLGANVLTYVSSSPNELIVKYPSGLFDQDQTEFEFDIIPDAGYCEEDATVSYLAYIQNDTGASCGGTSCGGNLIATGTSSESLDIKKAAVVINLDSAIGSVTVLDELITAAFTIDNTSDVEVTAPATIGAYFDVNLDGVYDAGDLELGSHIITSAIPAGGSISESIQFTATPTQACNILLVMKVDENPCICVPASVSMGSPSVLTGIGGSNVPVCEAYAGSSVELGSPNNPDYTYVWTGLTATDDITYLDAPTTAQPNFVYGGPKLAATTTFTYQVEITRPGGCTSTDTVDVTVGYIEDPVISSSELEICSDEYLSVTFGNTLSDDEIIKIWKNAALTTPANLPNTSGIWTSTELYPAGTGNIYATVENTVTGCRTDAITIAYTITDCVADLVTTKSVSPTTASIGQDVVFTINVSNIGSSVDKNVTLSDVLPNNVAYISDNSSGTYNRVTGLWTVGEIASGSSASLEITANINAEAAGGTVTNTTTAASGDYTDDTLIAGDVLDATVSVNSLVIAAANDNYSGVNGFEGNTNLGNILTGTGDDSLNGDPVTTADVAITYPTPATVNGNPITGTAPIISASGDVSVPAGTPAGTYSIPYTICEIGNSSNCSNATVTVVVEAPAIVATNDDYTASPVLSEDGNANLGNILGGTGDDTLNGVATDINEIDITLTSGMFFDGGSGPVPATAIVPEVDPLTGDVSVPAGTPAGRYTINYNICEELNPSNCSADAVVTIVVIEPPVANVDSNSGNTTTQPSTPINILSNDLLGDGITTATVLNTTVDLDPNTAGDQDVLVVPGEGTWNYNTSTGELVFTPETIVDGFTSNYTNDPTPIEYTLTETQTGLSDTATVTVDYDAVSPTAEDDSSLVNVGGAVTIDPLVTNGGLADSDPDGE
ncbi:hypothetical protein, partial [Algibacter lectus]|uniref:hypothetical protein n=1 Tax=Algibacter lectus TaxID=221126 RepID=UPI002493DCE2